MTERSRDGTADEAELVEATQAGDAEAFGRLVEAYLDQAYAVAVGIMRSPDAAEDAVQSAFLRALERIDDLRPGSRFGPWFYRVLKTVCLNERRYRGRRSHETIEEELTPSTSDPEDEAFLAMRREEVLDALDSLPPMQRMAITLYDLEGYTHREVARILEIEPGTSRAHVHYGRRALRERLAPDRGERNEDD